MTLTAAFAARRIAERFRAGITIRGAMARLAGLLRKLGPYAAIELILPGGSILVVLLWLYRRSQRTVSA